MKPSQPEENKVELEIFQNHLIEENKIKFDKKNINSGGKNFEFWFSLKGKHNLFIVAKGEAFRTVSQIKNNLKN